MSGILLIVRFSCIRTITGGPHDDLVVGGIHRESHGSKRGAEVQPARRKRLQIRRILNGSVSGSGRQADQNVRRYGERAGRLWGVTAEAAARGPARGGSGDEYVAAGGAAGPRNRQTLGPIDGGRRILIGPDDQRVREVHRDCKGAHRVCARAGRSIKDVGSSGGRYGWESCSVK